MLILTNCVFCNFLWAPGFKFVVVSITYSGCNLIHPSYYIRCPSFYIITIPPKKKNHIRAGGERAKEPTGEDTSAKQQLGETSARLTRGSSKMPTRMKEVTIPARKGGGEDSSKKSDVYFRRRMKGL